MGKFNAHEIGFGFVEPEGEEKQPDIFIPAKSINGALNEDVVEVEIVDRTGRSKEDFAGRDAGSRQDVGQFRNRYAYRNKLV